ncbi:T9SS type A sorting domain-containing protein, partial [bacterium]|nr:T9SS type A sorting domain-containing protein [bacterium]
MFFTTIVQIDDCELWEANGNGDNRPGPGETIDMVVSLSVPENRKSADECHVSLFCNDNELEFTNSEFNPGEIGNGEQITNEDNPFSFSVPNDMEPRPVNFIITVEAQPGDWTTEYEFEMMIGWPDILLIDVTEDEDATEAMMDVFGDHNLPWVDYLNLAEEVVIPNNLLSHYDAVLWHTFNCEESIFFEFEEVTLMDYLDAGGTLIMSSPYTIMHYGNIDFFSEYMGAGLENPDLESRYVYSYEGSGSFEGANLFLGGGDGAGFATVTPGLSIEGGGEAVLYYPDEDEIAGIGGIKNETDDFKTLLLSFPIESIGGAAGTEERYEFIERIWNWVNGEHGVFDENEPQVYDFKLDAAYPNPFNSTSVIPFSLTQSDNISLKLFNVAGREVGQIASGDFKAGNHKVILDASKFGLTTGVYYIQLDGKNGTSTSKALYIR